LYYQRRGTVARGREIKGLWAREEIPFFWGKKKVSSCRWKKKDAPGSRGAIRWEPRRRTEDFGVRTMSRRSLYPEMSVDRLKGRKSLHQRFSHRRICKKDVTSLKEKEQPAPCSGDKSREREKKIVTTVNEFLLGKILRYQWLEGGVRAGRLIVFISLCIIVWGILLIDRGKKETDLTIR